ncbi:unnamed protein product [Cochlearia groenlandica]
MRLQRCRTKVSNKCGTENGALMEEETLKDSVDIQAREKEPSVDQGTNTLNPLESMDRLEIDVVSEALSVVDLKENRNNDYSSHSGSTKLTGLPRRKYNSVLLASPKKRLLLNRLYDAKKQTGKGLKFTNVENNVIVNLSKKGDGESGIKVTAKDQGVGPSQGKKGSAGGGIPKPPFKK